MILMVGCAGGTLVTILTRVGHAVTIVDIEPKSFDIARQGTCLSQRNHPVRTAA